jgi:hypothetical protein
VLPAVSVVPGKTNLSVASIGQLRRGTALARRIVEEVIAMPHGNPDDEDREFEAQKRDEAVEKALQADADGDVVSPGAAIDEELADEDADDEEDDEAE